MKVHPLKSLGAKLFLYMGLLVVLAVAGNSLQYVRTFVAFQADQVKDQVELSAERAASQLESVVDGWRAQLTTAWPSIYAASPDVTVPQTRQLLQQQQLRKAEQLQRMQEFVDSNADFLAIELFEAPSARSTKLSSAGGTFTTATNDSRFEDKVPAAIRTKMQSAGRSWLKKRIPKAGKAGMLVESFAKATGLPIMMLAVRFDVDTSPTVVWGVLAVWQSNLIKALPKSRYVDSAVIDGRGTVFASPSVADMVGRTPFSSQALVKGALSGRTSSGFEAEYRDNEGRRRLGAYVRVPKLGLTVLVEQDAEAGYQALSKTLYTTMLTATLFILIAVLFAYVAARGIGARLKAIAAGTAKLGAGDLHPEVDVGPQDELAALAEDVNDLGRRIHGLIKAHADKVLTEHEIATSRLVQTTLFPRVDGRNGPLFVTGFYRPAVRCGGDLWGRLSIGDGIEFVFIADAMGQGAPPALVSAMAYAATMTLGDLAREQRDLLESPARTLERLNRVLFEAVRGSVAMTFFAAVIDTQRGTVTFANAGHNFPILLPQHADDPRVGERRPTARNLPVQPLSLQAAGMPLGMEAEARFEDKTMELRAGDKILFFSDGLIECASPKGEVWGRKYLMEQAAETSILAPVDMKDELLSRAFSFFGPRQLDDDVTVVIVELDKRWNDGTDAGESPAVAPARTAPPPPPLRLQLASLADPTTLVDRSASPEEVTTEGDDADDMGFALFDLSEPGDEAEADPAERAPPGDSVDPELSAIPFSIEATATGFMPYGSPDFNADEGETTDSGDTPLTPVLVEAEAEAPEPALPLASGAPAPRGRYRIKLKP